MDEREAAMKAAMPALWDLFVQKVALETFGEREMISEGKKLVNFYGSVAHHREVFMKAVEEHFGVSK